MACQCAKTSGTLYDRSWGINEPPTDGDRRGFASCVEITPGEFRGRILSIASIGIDYTPCQHLVRRKGSGDSPLCVSLLEVGGLNEFPLLAMVICGAAGDDIARGL